jgi:hypothetical protein
MLVLVHLEKVLILTQDSCMVCAECTIASEFVLDAPDVSPRSRGLSRSLFRSIWI